MPTALMVVDVQQGMFALPSPLHRGEEVVRRIADLLDRARVEGVPVVHIQHDGGPGHVLAKGSPGWPPHRHRSPRRRRHADRNVRRFRLPRRGGAGRVVLVADGHTTYDTPVIAADLIIAHHNGLLGRAFVELAEARQVRFQE